MRFARGFGLVMIAGRVAALVHAMVLAWFPTTGNAALARLNARLEQSRRIAAERDRRVWSDRAVRHTGRACLLLDYPNFGI